jgi:hypothetical protein
MNRDCMEMGFIMALMSGFSLTSNEAIRAWNNGSIMVFDLSGIERWYKDILENIPENNWQNLLRYDIKQNYVIQLDSNTFAMYI